MNDMLNKHFESIETHRRLVWQIGNVLKVNPQQLAVHDLSKYSDEEFVPYAEWFGGDRTKETVHSNFYIAVKHHYGSNCHHWEYWANSILSSPPYNNAPYNMPLKYIIEMVCDWQAMEIQHHTRQDMSGWLNREFDKMILHKETKDNVLDVLDEIGYNNYYSEKGFTFNEDNTAAKKISGILQKSLNVKWRSYVLGD